MGKSKSFKDEFTFEQRYEESRDIIAKYPDRVPVIAERYSKTDLPDMEKKKFLVPRDMSIGQFIHILSSRLHLTPGKALFAFVKNTLPQTATLLDAVYESFKDEDDFCICATAVKRPLVMLEFILVNIIELYKVMLILCYSLYNCVLMFITQPGIDVV